MIDKLYVGIASTSYTKMTSVIYQTLSENKNDT